MDLVSVNKKNRLSRLIVGTFLPAFYVALATFMTMAKLPNDGLIIFLFFVVVPIFVFALIVSMIYSLLMELIINSLFKNHLIAILSSAVLGLLVLGLSTIGIVVGLAVGAILRWMYIKAPAF